MRGQTPAFVDGVGDDILNSKKRIKAERASYGTTVPPSATHSLSTAASVTPSFVFDENIVCIE